MTTLNSLFTFTEGDSQCDDMYVLKSNEKIHIQDTSAYGGGFCVMKEDNGCFYDMGDYPTLDKAMIKSIDCYNFVKIEMNK
jgi:hypothetical protein